MERFIKDEKPLGTASCNMAGDGITGEMITSYLFMKANIELLNFFQPIIKPSYSSALLSFFGSKYSTILIFGNS
jgi:hypothetical protein